MLCVLRKSNPKLFSKHKSLRPAVTANDFLEHFKTLEGINLPEDQHPELDEESIFEELDKGIVFKEIRNAVKNTTNEKSCGPDMMLNETFKYYIDLLIPSLHYLFNNILNNGLFPSLWSRIFIVPIHIKGDISDPNNYRGITLISNIGKKFSSILNFILLKWSCKNNVISDAQFGFEPMSRTTDAIFSLIY